MLKSTKKITSILLYAILPFILPITNLSANNNTLAGKVVLVTGGSRGIGKAIVQEALYAGADVIIHYNHNQSKAADIANCHPSHTTTVQADLSEEDGAFKLWNKALSWKGHIDVLINNAGILESIDPNADPTQWHKDWSKTLRVNLQAPADLTKEAVTHFKERGGGIIINIASLAAFTGYIPTYSPYAISKAGLIALTKTTAKAYAKDHIFAYSIAPGFTQTDMVEQFKEKHGQAALDYAKKQIPIGDLAPAQEVANIAIFLASGKASHATGMTFDINGASYLR